MKERNINKSVNITKFFKQRVLRDYTLSLTLILFILLAISFNGKEINGKTYSIADSLTFSLILTIAPFLLSLILIRMLTKLNARIITLNLIANVIFQTIVLLTSFQSSISENIISFLIVLIIVIDLLFSWLFEEKKRVMLISLIHLITYVGFIYIFLYFPIKSVLLGSILILLVLSVVIYIIFLMLNNPIKNSFGVKSTDVIKRFLSDWFNKDDNLNEILEKIGTNVNIPIKGIIFKSNHYRFYFLIPYFHFGPFGTVGGANAPALFKEELGDVVVFHSTSNHDLNPVNNKQVYHVINKIKQLKPKFKEMKGYLETISTDNARADIIETENEIVVGLSRAPKTTEDITIAGGLYLMEYLKHKFKKAIVYDEHNSSVEKITFFDILSDEFRDYVDVVKQIKKHRNLKHIKGAFGRIDLKHKSIGGNGITITLLKGNKAFAYIVIDTNGIEENTKKRIEKKIRNYGYIPVVCTTDSHEQNDVEGVKNAFSINEEEWKQLEKGIDKIMHKPLEPLTYYNFSIEENIKVVGEGATLEISTLISTMIDVMKIVLPIMLIETIAISFYLLKRFIF